MHSISCVSCYLTANLSFIFAIAWCVPQAAQDKSWQMNAIDLSQTMRGLANMRLSSRLLVQALVHRAATILDTFNPQVWAIHCRTCTAVACVLQERHAHAIGHHDRSFCTQSQSGVVRIQSFWLLLLHGKHSKQLHSWHHFGSVLPCIRTIQYVRLSAMCASRQAGCVEAVTRVTGLLLMSTAFLCSVTCMLRNKQVRLCIF